MLNIFATVKELVLVFFVMEGCRMYMHVHYLQDTFCSSDEIQTPCPLQFANSLQSATSLQFAPRNPV